LRAQTEPRKNSQENRKQLCGQRLRWYQEGEFRKKSAFAIFGIIEGIGQPEGGWLSAADGFATHRRKDWRQAVFGVRRRKLACSCAGSLEGLCKNEDHFCSAGLTRTKIRTISAIYLGKFAARFAGLCKSSGRSPKPPILSPLRSSGVNSRQIQAQSACLASHCLAKLPRGARLHSPDRAADERKGSAAFVLFTNMVVAK